jgi:hypothetical protein
MEERNGGSVLVNGATKKVQRGSWTKDQKRQIVASPSATKRVSAFQRDIA